MDMSEFDVIIGMDWLTAHWSSLIMIVGGLLPTHRMVVVLCFTPDSVRLQVAWTVDGLASKPYPRGQGETRFEATSSGL